MILGIEVLLVSAFLILSSISSFNFKAFASRCALKRTSFRPGGYMVQ